MFSFRFASKAVENKLLEIVSDTLSYREGKKIIRNDFLHILSQLKKTSKDYEFTDVDVTAHAAGFFADGYETSSIVMSFVLFELSVNPEAQSKLREEINKAFEENDHKLPYEVLKALPYLDGVINGKMPKSSILIAKFSTCRDIKDSSSCVVVAKIVH
jgi:cytochrome P450